MEQAVGTQPWNYSLLGTWLMGDGATAISLPGQEIIHRPRNPLMMYNPEMTAKKGTTPSHPAASYASVMIGYCQTPVAAWLANVMDMYQIM